MLRFSLHFHLRNCGTPPQTTNATKKFVAEGRTLNLIELAMFKLFLQYLFDKECFFFLPLINESQLSLKAWIVILFSDIERRPGKEDNVKNV